MAWLGAAGDGWNRAYELRGRQSGYYNLLAHGLAGGHLYMDAPVDPGLLSPNPEVRRRTPYLLDASLYRGHYYLYFGVVPAVLVFLPYSMLTGHDLPENAGVLVLVAAGFLFQLAAYRGARRRYFPGIGRAADLACLLLLAFASGTPALLADYGFYQVAVAGAYACLSAAWWAGFRALHAECHPLRWLALASLGLGLAVGCRPNALCAAPAAFVLAVALERRGSRRGALAAVALLPAAAIGLLLAAYNYLRFGNPLEFGFHYQLSQLVQGHGILARPSFFWPNLRWYYLRPPVLSPYFPYVFPINAQDRPDGYYGYESVHGQWLVALAAAACAAGLWLARLRPGRAPRAAAFAGALALAFPCLFLGMAFFGFRADRYVPDFQGTLVLLLALAGGWLCARPFPSRLLRVVRAVFPLLATAAAATNILGSLQLLDGLQNRRPIAYRALAYPGNYPSYLLARWGFWHYGPIRFQAKFRAVTHLVEEPLLVTGTPNFTDGLFADQYPQGLLRLSLVHEGYGGFQSELIPIQPGRPYEVEVDLGSLYPPGIHPWFRGWSETDIAKLKTTARVLFDGREAIRAQLKTFDAPPQWVVLGRNPAGGGQVFSGTISSVTRLPPRSPAALGLFSEAGVWRIRAALPTGAGRYPLLASGVAGHGNLLLLDVAPDGRLRLGLDQWNGGLSESPFLALDSKEEHVIEIFAGPQLGRQKPPAEWRLDPRRIGASAHTLRVWVDGRPVWTAAVTLNLDSYDFVSLGSNPQGFSTATTFFVGEFHPMPYAQSEMRDFIARNLAAPAP